MKKKNNDTMIVEPARKGIAVFSYDGHGLAVNIGEHNIDDIFDIAKLAIKKQIEEDADGNKEIGEEIRPTGKKRRGKTS